MASEHYCAVPNCPNKTTTKYCTQHTWYGNWSKQATARTKNTDNQSFYNSKAWHNVRYAYESEHPFCEVCLAQGVLTPTKQIHHKIPIREGGAPLDPANLLALCTACHSRLHAKRGDYLGKGKG